MAPSLPEAWAHDAARRTAAEAPADVRARTKTEMALELVAGAVPEGVATAPVTAGAACGTHRALGGELTRLGLRYAAGVDDNVTVASPPVAGGRPRSARAPASALPPRPRSRARPERHVADSFVTRRLAFARCAVRGLPRRPTCHGEPPDRATREPPAVVC